MEGMTALEGTARRPLLAKFVFVAIAVAISAIVTYPWPRPGDPLTAPNERRVLSEVALEQLDGGTWRLTEHRGQVVLINYWASWCGPCRVETPGLVRIAQDTKGVAVVGVSMDKGNRGVVREFVKEMKVRYPIAFPERMSQMEEGMAGVPTTMLVDREGRVAKVYVGETREREFREDVKKLLAEGS
jgi:thiol-disulfide isomerase/thioredoxin